MIEIVFDQASFFKKIIDSLKGLVEDIAQSMDLQAMDISHVSLISISLPSDLFSFYCRSDETNLLFNVDVLNNILKSAIANDLLNIMSEKQNEAIEIQLLTQNEDKNTRFHFKPVDIEGDPVYKYKANFVNPEFNSENK